MKNCCALCVLLVVIVGITEAGYVYKSRHPPPPPLPPAKIHYGPKPPSPGVYYSNKPSYHLNHGHSHGHIRRPSPPHHAHRTPIRIPLRPYIPKPTPPSPPPFPHAWKSQSSFRAPVVKETFHALSQNNYISQQHYIKDDDKGPIHTIPAPNLGPEDKPKQIINQNYREKPSQNLFHSFSNKPNLNHFQNTFSTFDKPEQSSVLSAVLNHGTKVQSKPSLSEGYQVTEDPSLHKPYSGESSYFAPDPDPSVPTLKVPETLDPHSLPSNGQIPFDLLFQQEAERLQLQAQQQQQYAEGAGNTLTSQDLFHLLNGIGQQSQDQQQLQQQQQYAAQQQLFQQQYLQAAGTQPNYQDLYNSAALAYPQQFQQQVQYQQQAVQPDFHPQFQTFNYDEQTQEGAHGSDSFPSASAINVEVKRAVPKTSTAIKGENLQNAKLYQSNFNVIQKSNLDVKNKKNFFENSSQEPTHQSEVADNQVDYDDTVNEEEEENETPLKNYYSVLPNKQAAETLATLAAAGNINNQILKNHNEKNEETRSDITADKDYSEVEREEVDQPRTEEPIHADNVNMQKGIRVYESIQTEHIVEPERTVEEQEYEDQEGDYSQDDEIMEHGSSQPEQTSAHSQSQLPFGAKLRPKRI